MSNDINQEILGELRKLRQVNQRMSYFTLAVVVAAVAFIAVEQHKHQQNQQSQQEYPWSKVDAAWGQLDYPKALSLAQNILSQDTNNDWGLAYLGNIYFRMGDITNAEAAFKRAYQLYPNKTYEEDIAVCQKRIAMDRGGQSQSQQEFYGQLQ